MTFFLGRHFEFFYSKKKKKLLQFNVKTKCFHMRYHLFLHYGWFLQNLGKEAVRTNMHTTVSISLVVRWQRQMQYWAASISLICVSQGHVILNPIQRGRIQYLFLISVMILGKKTTQKRFSRNQAPSWNFCFQLQ